MYVLMPHSGEYHLPITWAGSISSSAELLQRSTWSYLVDGELTLLFSVGKAFTIYINMYL